MIKVLPVTDLSLCSGFYLYNTLDLHIVLFYLMNIEPEKHWLIA